MTDPTHLECRVSVMFLKEVANIKWISLRSGDVVPLFGIGIGQVVTLGDRDVMVMSSLWW